MRRLHELQPLRRPDRTVRVGEAQALDCVPVNAEGAGALGGSACASSRMFAPCCFKALSTCVRCCAGCLFSLRSKFTRMENGLRILLMVWDSVRHAQA